VDDLWATKSEGVELSVRAISFQSLDTPFMVIQGHLFWYQSKACIRLPISPS